VLKKGLFQRDIKKRSIKIKKIIKQGCTNGVYIAVNIKNLIIIIITIKYIDDIYIVDNTNNYNNNNNNDLM